jgi:hypothetical protein
MESPETEHWGQGCKHKCQGYVINHELQNIMQHFVSLSLITFEIKITVYFTTQKWRILFFCFSVFLCIHMLGILIPILN